MMKFARPLGWAGIVCGLIGMIYTFYHDAIWNRYDGLVILGWKSDLAVALGVVANIVGANLLIVAARQRGG